MQEPRVLGLVGWGGSGKTTLITKLLPLLVRQGLRVATLKHAHHDFDVDVPGKDSYEHRKAGASEVIVCSARRWVQMRELGRDREPSLGELLRKLGPCDLVLVEGFKRERHPKLEVYREVLGKPLLYPGDDAIRGVLTNDSLPGEHPPVIGQADLESVTSAILAMAEPLSVVLARLET